MSEERSEERGAESGERRAESGGGPIFIFCPYPRGLFVDARDFAESIREDVRARGIEMAAVKKEPAPKTKKELAELAGQVVALLEDGGCSEHDMVCIACSVVSIINGNWLVSEMIRSLGES